MLVNKIEIICKNCGKVFNVFPSLATEGKKYCSKECCNAHMRGENSRNWKGGRHVRTRINRNCSSCGKEFKPLLSEVNRRGGKFCSRNCMYIFYHGKNHPNYNQIERTCKHCGKKFSAPPARIKAERGKYCSKQCFTMSGSIECICKHCGKKIKRQLSSINRRKGQFIYCSVTCMAKAFSEYKGENANGWKGGYFPYYGSNWDNMNGQRQRALEKSGFISEISKENNKLEVHHIISVKVFINKYIDLCLKPYIPEIKNGSCLEILPYDIIPSMLFDEVNNLDNLVVLTSLEHHFYGEMPVGFFMAIRENMIDD